MSAYEQSRDRQRTSGEHSRSLGAYFRASSPVFGAVWTWRKSCRVEIAKYKGAMMSTLDQPILIANSNYHVGHQIAIFVAKEQGFFTDEGLKEFEYDSRGLIPGPIEREGLAMAIKNHGVDIAPAVDVEAAI